MILSAQVHDLEVRVRKLEQEKKQLLIKLENLESKINNITKRRQRKIQRGIFKPA